MFDSENFKPLSMKLISKKIEEKGYSLTDDQLVDIEEQIANTSDDTLTIELLDDEDINLQIKIEEDIVCLIDEYTQEISDKMPKVIEELSEALLTDLRSRAPEMLSEHAELRNKFQWSVLQKWGKALDLLEMFIVIAIEAGEDFNKEFRPSASQNSDFEFDVLTRLHARSCQIANEVLTLLKSGYADGAHARWRTMHEVVVTGLFVNKFGQDTAERYLLHDIVESYRASQVYQRHCLQLGYEPYTNEELQQLQSTYQQLVNRFGHAYTNSYGWAAHALGKHNPRFSDIEQAADLGHWRPHYKLASHNIHANSKGALFKLGLYPKSQELLLAGPSDTGFTDPGHSTAISLLQITTSLLTLKPNIDRLTVCRMLSTLAEEIGNSFLSIQKRGEESPQP